MGGVVFFDVGGVFARDREDPAPTGGRRGARNDWHCGEGMRLLQGLQVAVYHLPEGAALAR